MNNIKINTIARKDVENLLEKIQTYNENPRIGSTANLSLDQFRKYLISEKSCDTNENSRFIGNFEDGKCWALMYVNKIPRKGEDGNPGQNSNLDHDCYCIAEIQSFRKGFGKPLIDYVLLMAKNVWWLAEPEGGDDLLEYYRQFGAEEAIIYDSKWRNGADEHVFYKAETENDKNIILDYLGAEKFDFSNMQKYWLDVIEAYQSIFGLDMSYMKMNIGGPHYTNGKPCLEMKPEESGGSWTNNGIVYINYDMPSVMKHYGIEDETVEHFTKIIMAHELAHEVYNIVDEKFKMKIVSAAQAENFSTAYLDTVKPEKKIQETFCEYMAHLIVD